MRPIVRKVLCDCETRTAVRAIGKGITITSIARRKHILKTCFACCSISGNCGIDLAFLAFSDCEIGIAFKSHIGRMNEINSSQRWFLFPQKCRKTRNLIRITFQDNPDTFSIVENFAFQSEFSRDSVNSGSKSDSLNKSVNTKKFRNHTELYLKGQPMFSGRLAT